MGDEIERPDREVPDREVEPAEREVPDREIDPPEHEVPDRETPAEKAEREYNEAADRNDIVGMETAKEAMEEALAKP